MIPVLALKDDSGHWYVIPKTLLYEWEYLQKKANSVGIHTDEWYDIIDEFTEKFEDYRTGGDLNNTQLYAEI